MLFLQKETFHKMHYQSELMRYLPVCILVFWNVFLDLCDMKVKNFMHVSRGCQGTAHPRV